MAWVITILIILFLYPIGRGWVLLFVRIARLLGGRIKYWDGVLWSILAMFPLFFVPAFGVDWSFLDYGINERVQRQIYIGYFVLGVSAFGWIISFLIPEEYLVSNKQLREETLKDALESGLIDEETAREIVEETWPLADEVEENQRKRKEKSKTE